MWSPMTEDEFNLLIEEQYAEMSEEEKASFNLFRVSPWRATIRRSERVGDETVFVVAELPGGAVLYFDDIEYGFNVSLVDASRRILDPGGNQCSLKDAVNCSWPKWNIPISEAEFLSLFDSQYRVLNDSERISFNLFRVALRKASVNRSEGARDEPVFVIAELPDRRVLYFNDARHSFNISTIDEEGRITDFSDDHNSLKDAVVRWFPTMLPRQ
jgi:hypothetical protein